MKRIKKLVILCVVTAAVFIGFMLPTIVGAIWDSQINGSMEVIAQNTVQLKMVSDLTLLERFLVIDYAGVSSVNLESGQNMDYEEAVLCLKEELEKLFPAVDSDPLISISTFSEAEYNITLLVSEEGSVLLWDFYLENDRQDRIRVLLEDDSGLILSFQYILCTDNVSENETTRPNFFESLENDGYAPEDYVDTLAVVYADYLDSAGMLTDVEIMFEWAWDASDIIYSSDGNISYSSGDYLVDDAGSSVAESDTIEPDEWISFIDLISDEEEYELKLSLTENMLSIHNID